MTNQWIKAQMAVIISIAISACATESAGVRDDFVGAAASDFRLNLETDPKKTINFANGDAFVFGNLQDHPRVISSAFATEGGQPAGASQAHEAVAASLWSGRTFKTMGRPEDDRILQYRKHDIANKIPDGWTLSNGGVRHDQSGLQCDAEDRVEIRETDKDGNETEIAQAFELNEIVIFNSQGLDVGCNYISQGNAIITKYASYYPDKTLNEHVDASIAAIRQNFKVQSEVDVLLPSIGLGSGHNTADALGDHHAGGYLINDINGIPYKTALWLTVSNNWHVKVRATYPKDNFASEFMGAIGFVISNWRVKTHTDKKGPPTSATGAEV